MPLDAVNAASRRQVLKCLAYGGAGTLFTLAGGVLTPVSLARAAGATGGADGDGHARGVAGIPLFVQISDTHIGFSKDANPDVSGTLMQAIEMFNALPGRPDMVIHTGDITHLSKPEEFDTAALLLSKLRITELHTTPGEHDVADASASEYFKRYGKPSGNRGYYSFDHHGVHFIGLVNVLQFKANSLASLGAAQLEWLEADLEGRSASTPVVVFAHMPMWNIYEPWGWGTADAAQAMGYLRRFGSVTVLNGHIHQVVQKLEGHITFHTARSTAYPQPAPGAAPGPGPLKVPPGQLPGMLGITSVSVKPNPGSLALADRTLA